MRFFVLDVLLATSSLVLPCSAFQSTKTILINNSLSSKIEYIGNALSQPRHHKRSCRISMSERDIDDDDDDDEYIDDADLGDWRSFRKTLVDSGLSSGEDGVDVESSSDNSSVVDTPSKPSEKRPKSVSAANEELLKSQSEELAKEYIDGVWAHESSIAEVGGLVVRVPLEMEIYRNKDKITIGKVLKERLETNEDNSNTAPLLSNTEESGKSPDLSFSLVAAQTLLWYKKAQALIEEEMAKIAGLANKNGEINPRQLDPSSENLLKMYLENQETWQEVGLVAERNTVDGSAVTYVLNRPMAFKMSENLARLVLFGAMNAMADSSVAVSQSNKLSKFLRAFENSCAVYVGGPDKMESSATIIHGISDLEGATEVSPGTGIYRGGLEAAISGVLKGKYKPLDFRFFVGCHEYKNGDLDVAIYSNKYQPIACARALALKQCIQLPKPLWHEVLELCGGELREVSRLELMKRDDIQE